MEEIWLPIKGFEGLYEVSSFGRVRNLNYKRTGKIMVLSQSLGKNGYLYVKLKEKNYTVHRLVASAFIPNWFDEPCVNHIDENKNNNNFENLEWCDFKYNNNYGTARERTIEKTSKTVLQFLKTGEFVREWFSTAEAGRNGFNQGHIAACCRGEEKFHKGFIWKYKEVI